MPRVAFYLACGSAVAALVSIAACQILLGAALGTLLVSRERLALPAHLAAFEHLRGAYPLALLFSTDPRAGLPQLKKLYVYLMLARGIHRDPAYRTISGRWFGRGLPRRPQAGSGVLFSSG